MSSLDVSSVDDIKIYNNIGYNTYTWASWDTWCLRITPVSEDTWILRIRRYNNIVVFRTPKRWHHGTPGISIQILTYCPIHVTVWISHPGY